MNYGLISAVLLNKVALQRLQRLSEKMSIDIYPIVGVGSANKEDLKFVEEVYINFKEDLSDALRYFNIDSNFIPQDIKKALEDLSIDFQIDKDHKEITDYIVKSINKEDGKNFEECIVRLGHLRKFLG